ncbi:hypothetical protein [Halarcobacter sp.]|uniref:hypothetical protein n=1 Tax=Halarcobacter sp. TaxID=2321133 RepID=UPI002AA8091C|nr:hypothetical protein [Halarcobacter sp.]
MESITENIEIVDKIKYKSTVINNSYSEINPDTKWKEIILDNPLLQNRVTVNEFELSLILGRGSSESTLNSLRIDGKHFIQYIQVKKGARVLYPIIYVCESITQISVANKHEWVVRQIKKSDYVSRYSNVINQNSIAKLMGVKAGTISEYRKQGLFIDPIKGTLFSIDNLVRWILKNSIKSVY